MKRGCVCRFWPSAVFFDIFGKHSREFRVDDESRSRESGGAENARTEMGRLKGGRSVTFRTAKVTLDTFIEGLGSYFMASFYDMKRKYSPVVSCMTSKASSDEVISSFVVLPGFLREAKENEENE